MPMTTCARTTKATMPSAAFRCLSVCMSLIAVVCAVFGVGWAHLLYRHVGNHQHQIGVFYLCTPICRTDASTWKHWRSKNGMVHADISAATVGKWRFSAQICFISAIATAVCGSILVSVSIFYNLRAVGIAICVTHALACGAFLGVFVSVAVSDALQVDGWKFGWAPVAGMVGCVACLVQAISAGFQWACLCFQSDVDSSSSLVFDFLR